MRYGFILNFLTALKMGFKKKSFTYFNNYIIGYCKAVLNKPNRLVTKAQGQFIRRLRWQGILNKVS
jgi:hypothetical protein